MDMYTLQPIILYLMVLEDSGLLFLPNRVSLHDHYTRIRGDRAEITSHSELRVYRKRDKCYSATLVFKGVVRQ